MNTLINDCYKQINQLQEEIKQKTKLSLNLMKQAMEQVKTPLEIHQYMQEWLVQKLRDIGEEEFNKKANAYMEVLSELDKHLGLA